MQSNFLCYTCHQKSIQFTILICDHIICSKCLNKNLKKLTQPQLSMIQCKCSMKTYCNQDQMRLSLKTPEMLQIKKQLQKIKQLENQTTQISNFIIYQSDIISKNFNNQNSNSDCQRNKENFNSINMNHMNQKYSFNPTETNYSKYFLKTEPLNIDQTNPFFIEQGEKGCHNHHNIGKKNTVKGVKSVQSIKSMSPSEKISQAVSPRVSKHKQNNTKTSTALMSSNMRESTQSLNSLAKQLQKQLKYINIQYQKQIQSCKKTFKKILKSIESSYQKMSSSLKKFYLQQIVQIESTQKDNLLLTLPKVIQNKYNHHIGMKLQKLNESLFQLFDSRLSQFKNLSNDRQRLSRQTVFLSKDIQKQKHKENSFMTMNNNNMNKKSSNKSSKSKLKQCALYLAISPQKKNDRVINYIDVIKKQCNKISKKSNLTKKVIKGDKIRIY